MAEVVDVVFFHCYHRCHPVTRCDHLPSYFIITTAANYLLAGRAEENIIGATSLSSHPHCRQNLAHAKCDSSGNPTHNAVGQGHDQTSSVACVASFSSFAHDPEPLSQSLQVAHPTLLLNPNRMAASIAQLLISHLRSTNFHCVAGPLSLH